MKTTIAALRRYGTAGLAATMLLAGASGTGRAQSLADAMVEAYLNSPSLAAARSDVKIFAERTIQQRAQGRARVEGDLTFQQLTRDNDGFGLQYPITMALNLTQPIYSGGQVSNSTEAARQRTTVREALLVGAEQQVLLDAVTAFVDVRRDEDFVSIAVNNVRVLNEQLRAAQERFEVGEVTRTDVEQARARLAAARSRLAAAEGALASAREAYQRAVGTPPQRLLPPPPLPDMPGSRDEAVTMALRDEPGVVAARIEREATSSDVRAAIGALLPQVSLQGSVAKADTLGDGLKNRNSMAIGVQVTVPIYTGGFNYSNVREAQAAAEGASADITSAMRTASRNVGVSWANLEVARASIRAGQLEVRAAQLAFEGVQEEAKVGARTTLDVLDAEQEVLDARFNLVAARRDEYVAAYSLLASVGKLTVDHLGLEVGEREAPGAYYESVRNRNFGYDATDDTVWRLDWRP